MKTQALGLYVHLPWCVTKCPYCDFNSHALKTQLPVADYLAALASDLTRQRDWFAGRTITSIFIGGGTPSLFPGPAIGQLLEQVNTTLSIDAAAEITMEVNPGSVERDHLRAYWRAGVNRLSIGVQSFSDDKLRTLERAHSAAEAIQAVAEARDAGFERMNLDLMYGLPSQTRAQAMEDLQQALALEPGHVSHYQLTLEPNTRFAACPPELPEPDAIAQMGEAGKALMAEHGYANYEISANALPGHACRHNLNYWRYGDYAAIGAGAHGKGRREDQVFRYHQRAQPAAYMAAMVGGLAPERVAISPREQVFEYFLNRTRLVEPFSLDPIRPLGAELEAHVQEVLAHAVNLGLLTFDGTDIQCTARGHQYLNDLQALFLP